MNNKCIIRLMGDVMIGRLVNNKITQLGYQYPWGNVLPILKKDGINIINLETALTTSNVRIPKVFNFKADPDKINTLTEANIHVVNIANNHILDFDVEGLKETIQLLDKYKIIHIGAGENLKEAKSPGIVTHHTIKIAILGCTDNEPSWQANKHPGTYFVKVGDLKKLKSEIINLRKEADLLILSIHWGPNMVEEPNEMQIDFAHQLIDLGIDIIHGHSAHIYQGIEIYNGKIILYDTGDFIDDYAVDPELRNDKSFLFECEITDKKITGLKLIPVIIGNMQVNLATGHNKKSSLARIQLLSSRFNTTISDNGEVLL